LIKSEDKFINNKHNNNISFKTLNDLKIDYQFSPKDDLNVNALNLTSVVNNDNNNVLYQVIDTKRD
jgi:hypothetical protein